MLGVNPYTIISHGKCPFFFAFLCLYNNSFKKIVDKDNRLLGNATVVSQEKPDRRERPMHALSPEMEELFGISGFIQHMSAGVHCYDRCITR
jgi:hypothetical protein